MSIDSIRHNLTVANLQNPVCDRCSLEVVRDHEDGLAELFIGAAEHGQDSVGILGIQVAGWFVGQDDSGAGDEGAGDGNALLFAAGELGWTMSQAALD